MIERNRRPAAQSVMFFGGLPLASPTVRRARAKHCGGKVSPAPTTSNDIARKPQ